MYHKLELSSIFRTLLAFPRVPHYTYKSLGGAPDAIRLLVVQPAPFHTSPIRCQVIESAWSQEQHGNEKVKGYSALSYTWGDAAQKSRIEIDGRRFHITKNLEQALRQLRKQRSTVILWADSLCINQEDIEERNLHVSQMREIYSAATKTTIFLGEATPGAVTLLHAILAATPLIMKSRTRNEIVRAIVEVSNISKVDLQNEALRILWRPYWTRIWIFQEIVVSANPWVQCGNVSIAWEVFCQSLIALLKYDTRTRYWGSGYSNEPRQRLEDMYWERRMYRSARGMSEPSPIWDMERGHKHTSTGKLRLLDLLVSKRGSEATDSRDKVYAVSGIASRTDDGSDLAITYQKSPALVYMDTVDYLLSHNESSYAVLSHAGLITGNPDEHGASKSTQDQPLPSWVPDWRVPAHHKIKISDWINSTPSHPNKISSHRYLPSHSILAIPGRLFHRIVSLEPDLSDVEPAAGAIGRVIWSASTLSTTYRRSLLSEGIPARLGGVREMLARSHPLTYRRKVAELDAKGGLLCLVPATARIGDVVVLFKDSDIPFLLRPWNKDDRVRDLGLWYKIQRCINGEDRLRAVRDKEDRELDKEILTAMIMKDPCNVYKEVLRFALVGECYVDGLMNSSKRDKRGKDKVEVVIALH